MNPMFRFLTTAAAFACASAASSFAAEPAAAGDGYVDFGNIAPSGEGKFVEVNLSPGLLKFASLCVPKSEPQAADLVRNLKHVRVNVVELNDANRAATLDRVRSIRHDLGTQGWTSLANVREQPKGDDVQIFAKMRGDEAIEGLVVTVISGGREVVLVNIVGDIKAEQIAMLADRFHIDPLKNVEMPKDHHS